MIADAMCEHGVGTVCVVTSSDLSTLTDSHPVHDILLRDTNSVVYVVRMYSM